MTCKYCLTQKAEEEGVELLLSAVLVTDEGALEKGKDMQGVVV